MTDMAAQQPEDPTVKESLQVDRPREHISSPTAGASQNSITKTRTREPKSGCIEGCNDAAATKAPGDEGASMNKINDGGCAFPAWELNCKGQPEMTGFGMSLRDYFAAKFAAAAMMTATSADHDFPNIDYQRNGGGPTVAERVATIAYRMADAMLRAREASND